MSADCAILIPTLPNRVAELKIVTAEFERQGFDVYSWGGGWAGGSWGTGLNEMAERLLKASNRGLDMFTYGYWFTGCDDIVPHVGWFDAARAMLEGEHASPASRYFHPDGEPLNPAADLLPHGTPMTWCRSFLLTPAIYQEVGPFIDATWYADIEYSERLDAAGWPIRACDGFSFTHLDTTLRDWRTDKVAAAELAEYERSVARRNIGAPS